jgi:tRNA (mo5U34)-methyltransferase
MQEDARRAEEAIAKQEKWYHRIEVAPGVWTPGTHDSPGGLEQIRMPEDLSGKRVLDIGARDGFYTFEAERRGAREVVSLDNEPPDKTGFSIAAELLGSKANFVTENVYSLSSESLGRFDVVLFLGVIYHLRHPLLALDRIHDICEDEALVLVETHMIDEAMVDRDGEFRPLAERDPELAGLPIVQYYPDRMLAGDMTSQWAPNRVALEGWMRGAGFDLVESWQQGYRGGAVGRRRELADLGERAIDEAAKWDMSGGTIERRTAMGRPE